MKAKSGYSGMVASTAAKGTISLFSVIAVFIGCFVVWSGAAVGSAIIQFIKGF